MRILIGIFLIFLLHGCKPPATKDDPADYTGFNEKRIWLSGYKKHAFDKQDDTICSLTIKVPSRLDTFYHWTDWSDCIPCGSVKYRFADKRYVQFAEGGFYWDFKPDSVYQFSIWHELNRDFSDTNNVPLQVKDSLGSDFFRSMKYGSGKNIIPILHDFKTINDRTFYITGFWTNDGYVTQAPTAYLTAETNFKNMRITFIAECGAKDTTGFINTMYKSMLSIKIEEKNVK